jgi:3-oxoacyl-[acyl-carrier protein] reductase
MKVVIITGTSSGIGKSLAEYYLSQGFIVCGCSRKECDIKHKNYKHYVLDISDEKAVINMVNDVCNENARIDVLINNAGMASMNHFLLTPLETVNKLFNTNYLGTFLFCREVAKKMLARKYGRIINFSTIATKINLEGELIYASTKYAVEAITNILSKELGSNGITVNTVAPSIINTNLTNKIPKEKIDKIIKRQAIKKMISVDDIINVIDFYISDRSKFITGQTLYLGGIN